MVVEMMKFGSKEAAEVWWKEKSRERVERPRSISLNGVVRALNYNEVREGIW